MTWNSLNILKILKYASSLQTIPDVIKFEEVTKNLNCKQAHLYLSIVLGKNETMSDSAVREHIRIWSQMGKFYFGVSTPNSEEFAYYCSERNEIINILLTEIMDIISDCCDRLLLFQKEYDSEKLVNILNKYKIEKNTSIESIKDVNDLPLNFSIRVFISENEKVLQYEVSKFATFMYENYEQMDYSLLNRFINMFRYNTDLNTEIKNETNNKKFIKKVKYEFGYHKPIHVLSSINELLTIDENSLLMSHLFLKNHWVDEITFNHNEMYGDENISESKKELLYIIGKLAMNYYDDIISPQEEDFFSSTFMSNALKEELKESFRSGDRTHEFNLRYINQNVDMNSLLYMLVGPRQFSDITLDHDNYPHWFFEHLQTFNDYEDDVTEFCISIRKPSLVEWFNKQTVIKM